MTLIEIMIAVGIASGLVLAVMEMMTFTTKSVKSSALSSDWVNLTTNIRLVLGHGTNCTDAFKTLPFSAAPNGTTTPLAELTLGVPPTTYIKSGAKINGFQGGPVPGIIAQQAITFRTAPDDSPRSFWVFEGGANVQYWKHRIILELAAAKMIGENPNLNAQAVGGSRVVSEGITGISLTVLAKNLAPTTIERCFSPDDAAAEACDALGGIYDADMVAPNLPYRCRLNDIFFTSGGPIALPSVSGAGSGQRIQLWAVAGPAAQGVKTNTDFGIGISPARMWFNAGRNAGDGFDWWNNQGGNHLMSLVRSGANNELSIEDPQGGGPAVLNFGSPGTGERIWSTRPGGAAGNIFYQAGNTHNFQSGGATRLTIFPAQVWASVDMVIGTVGGPTKTLTVSGQEWVNSDLTVIGPIHVKGGMSVDDNKLINGNFRIAMGTNGGYGANPLAGPLSTTDSQNIDWGNPFVKLEVSGKVYLNGDVRINGRSIYGEYGCVTTSHPTGKYTATCPAGYVVIAGGCSSSNRDYGCQEAPGAGNTTWSCNCYEDDYGSGTGSGWETCCYL